VNTTLYKNSKPSCEVELADNLFLKNKGEAKGGALMYTNVNFTESGPNQFTNNTSKNGEDLSSPPSRIDVKIPGATTSRRSLL
jgi:hypothetical protein